MYLAFKSTGQLEYSNNPYKLIVKIDENISKLDLRIFYYIFMRKTFKFRIYPNLEQQKSLNSIFYLCRFMYNSALEDVFYVNL